LKFQVRSKKRKEVGANAPTSFFGFRDYLGAGVAVHAIDEPGHIGFRATRLAAAAICTRTLVAGSTDIEVPTLAVGTDLVSVATVTTIATVNRADQEGRVGYALAVVGATFVEAKVLTGIILVGNTDAVRAGLVLPARACTGAAMLIIARGIHALPVAQFKARATDACSGHTGLRISALVSAAPAIIGVVLNVAACIVLPTGHHPGNTAAYARAARAEILVAVVAARPTICAVGREADA